MAVRPVVTSTTSFLADAFAHHAWANDRILEACQTLTRDQLVAEAAGTYGPILATLNHLIQTDAYYLSVLTDGEFPQLPADAWLAIDEMRAANRAQAAAWTNYLAGQLDPGAVVGRYRNRLGVWLAQVIHHGTDHRSQVCTALTSLGIEPPEIDVWTYDHATRPVVG